MTQPSLDQGVAPYGPPVSQAATDGKSGGTLNIDVHTAESIARRIDGVSAAFVKELMRRLSQAVIERGEGNNVEALDVDTALGELALGNDRLTRTLLGVD